MESVVFWLIATMLVFASASPHSRIPGGMTVPIEQFPSVAAVLELRESTTTYELICGGAILTSYYILSAAQCVTGRSLQVRVGSTFRSSGGTVHNVIVSIVHPEYRTQSADIAVLGLGSPILLNNPAVAQAPLPGQDLNPIVGMTSFIVGWGALALNEIPSESLRVGILNISDRRLCRDLYSNHSKDVSDNQVCASSPGVDFCTGNIGTPLYSAGVVVGIASFTLDCGVTAVPGIYTQVSSYTNWVLQVASGIPTI